MPSRLPVLLLVLAALPACWSRTSLPCEPPTEPVTDARAAGCMAVSEDGRLLMVRTRAGWAIPGGHVEAGESSAEAAVRETREEAGVTATAAAPFCVASNGFVAHTCTVHGRPAARSDGVEAAEARWWTREELDALSDAELRFPAQKPAYLRAVGATP